MNTTTMSLRTIKAISDTDVVTFTLGRIVYDGKKPEIEVLGNGHKCGYLGLYYESCFKIADTIDGDNILGSSGNVNLRKMVRIIDPVDHLVMVEIIRGMVMTALVVSLGKHGTIDINEFRPISRSEERRVG